VCQDLRGCFPGRGFRRVKDGSTKSSPVLLAAIRLGDGLLVHWLEDCSPEEISIGMPVIAQFKPNQERRGSILDIRSFKPGAGQETAIHKETGPLGPVSLFNRALRMW